MGKSSKKNVATLKFKTGQKEKNAKKSNRNDGIAPITGDTRTGRKPKRLCDCTIEEENAELSQILRLYKDAVKNARDTGYQAANDPGYLDPGNGSHKVGNCADWRQVSWSSLVTRTWKCWKVENIRARMHWTALTFHHFVRITGCSGMVYYLDPWSSGNADYWEDSKFTFNQSGWSHTSTHTHNPGDSPRDPGND